MPLTINPKHIYEPTPLQCGQAVLAMLADISVDEIIKIVGTDRETNLQQMFLALDTLGISYSPERISVNDKSELPRVALLSIETPKCWHWSMYFEGKFYDPEYGVLDDFPPTRRRYYWSLGAD